MKTFDITINGEVYPCTMTMGAFLDFKEVTGTDLSKADMTSLTDTLPAALEEPVHQLELRKA